MKGYKAFNKDFTCLDYQFSENSEHKIDSQPILCKQGFHFCMEMADCFIHYPLDEYTIICEVEGIGDLIVGIDKFVTNHIKILNRIEFNLDELLDKLSNDKDWVLRQVVANNPNTPSEILTKLSDDENFFVREEVANNLNTSSEILTKLSNDKEYYVRYCARYNPNYKK
jgi:hypothetical protein